MIISWGSLWCRFEGILESFWEDLGTILGSCWVQKPSWTLLASFVQAGSRFPHQNAGHFGGFWRAFGKDFGDILVPFVDMDFTMNFYMILKWFFMDFDTLWTSKIKQKAWRVVQKSTLHLIWYWMSMDIDFGRILRSGWEQLWVPIGFPKRLRKQVL